MFNVAFLLLCFIVLHLKVNVQYLHSRRLHLIVDCGHESPTSSSVLDLSRCCECVFLQQGNNR